MKTYTETRFQFGNSLATMRSSSTDAGGNKATTLNFAWIQLGGLRVGKDETPYDQFIGYAGNVIQDTIIPYGIKDTNVISYYFDAGSGFTGFVSLEEGTGRHGTIDSYVPHVVGGLKYKGDWGAITGVVAYDSNYEEVAGKVRLDVNVSKELSLFVMGGYGTDDNLSDPSYAVDAWVAASTSRGAATGLSGAAAPTSSTTRPRSTPRFRLTTTRTSPLRQTSPTRSFPASRSRPKWTMSTTASSATPTTSTGRRPTRRQHRRHRPLPALVLIDRPSRKKGPRHIAAGLFH